MSEGLGPIGSVTAVQSQASILTLSKSLRLVQENAAQLLQSLPDSRAATARTGPPVSGLGQQMDAFA